MGKGDQKSKRGKINNGSYGKTRLRKSSKPSLAAVVEKPVKSKAKTAEVEPKAEKPKTTRKKKTEE